MSTTVNAPSSTPAPTAMVVTAVQASQERRRSPRSACRVSRAHVATHGSVSSATASATQVPGRPTRRRASRRRLVRSPSVSLEVGHLLFAMEGDLVGELSFDVGLPRPGIE